jgi:hypothetical protein
MTLPRRTLFFAACSLCVIAGHAGVLRAFVNLARQDQTASHIVLIPFVTLALIYQRRDAIFSLKSAPLAGTGAILLDWILLAADCLVTGSQGAP